MIQACQFCHMKFPSNNQLHRHVRNGCSAMNKVPTTITVPTVPTITALSAVPITSMKPTPGLICSDAKKMDTTVGYSFHEWRYATANAHLTVTASPQPICLDTGCTMSLVDQKFLAEQAPSISIQQMSSPITVRGLGTNRHELKDFITLDIHLPGDDKTAVITREVHIVEDLKAKMLLGIDVLGPERVLLNLNSRIVTIRSCQNIRVPLILRLNPPIRSTASSMSRNTPSFPSWHLASQHRYYH